MFLYTNSPLEMESNLNVRLTVKTFDQGYNSVSLHFRSIKTLLNSYIRHFHKNVRFILYYLLGSIIDVYKHTLKMLL